MIDEDLTFFDVEDTASLWYTLRLCGDGAGPVNSHTFNQGDGAAGYRHRLY